MQRLIAEGRRHGPVVVWLDVPTRTLLGSTAAASKNLVPLLLAYLCQGCLVHCLADLAASLFHPLGAFWGLESKPGVSEHCRHFILLYNVVQAGVLHGRESTASGWVNPQ